MGGGREAAKYERKKGEKKPPQTNCGIAPITTEPNFEETERQNENPPIFGGSPTVESSTLPKVWPWSG